MKNLKITLTSRNAFLLGFILLLTIFVSACSQKPETLIEEYDEQKMEEAILQARATFDEFLSRFRNPQPGDEGFHIKVKIEDDNGTEHFWLGNLNLDNESYSGSINNEPGIVKCVKLGQQYNFKKDDVSDWMYMSNGQMQGNRTLRVALEAMPPDEAQALKQRFGW